MPKIWLFVHSDPITVTWINQGRADRGGGGGRRTLPPIIASRLSGQHITKSTDCIIEKYFFTPAARQQGNELLTTRFFVHSDPIVLSFDANFSLPLIRLLWTSWSPPPLYLRGNTLLSVMNCSRRGYSVIRTLILSFYENFSMLPLRAFWSRWSPTPPP